MLKEEWRDIFKYEGLYQVSNLGGVKSLNRYVRCKGGKKRLVKGRTLKFHISARGYKYVVLCKEGRLKTYKVHRLVLMMFDRLSRDDEECNHKDGIRYHNCIENLEWCTHKQNCYHRDNVLGKHSRGEKSGTSKLIESEVSEIRNLLGQEKLTQKQIGEKYSISPSVISSIKLNNSWK